MAAGCDMSAISLHKTGGSLTQSSALLLKENPIVDYNHLRNTINLTLTTSASYILMASIDFARRTLATKGSEILEDVLILARKYRDKINTIEGMYAFGKELIDNNAVIDFDETKLTVNVSGLTLTGYEVYDLLRERYGVQAELADVNNVLFILSLGDREEALDKLYEALCEIGLTYAGGDKSLFRKTLENPEVIVSPRDAYYAGKKIVFLKDAINEISGESVMVYPPGIPIITPGERISQQVIEYIEFLKTQDTIITGPDDASVEKIKVLGI
jgi:arginine/lysine/ornithine decarboxylase